MVHALDRHEGDGELVEKSIHMVADRKQPRRLSCLGRGFHQPSRKKLISTARKLDNRQSGIRNAGVNAETTL